LGIIGRWACIKKYWITHEGGDNYKLDIAFNYDQNIPLPSAFHYKIQARSNSEAEKVAKKMMDMIIQIGTDSVAKKLFSSQVMLDPYKAKELWRHFERTRMGIYSPELTIRWLASFSN